MALFKILLSHRLTKVEKYVTVYAKNTTFAEMTKALRVDYPGTWEIEEWDVVEWRVIE